MDCLKIPAQTKPAFATHIEESKRNRREAEIAVAKFIIPDGEDKVDSGIGLLYRPARLHRLTGQYNNPMPELTISSFRDYEFGLWMGSGVSSKSILDLPCRGFDVDLIWNPHFYK
jgi:hypothetical protein